MGYPLRDESPGYHHVVTRGNNKRDIYVDDADRIVFCLTVNRVARKYGWTILAYALMRNHYHLVISIDERGMSQGMRELNSAYARQFNARHGRINHLFGRRFWNRPLRTEASLMNAIRYVVQNPWRAGGGAPLEGYVWTSFAATLGLALSLIRLARDEVLGLFGGTAAEAQEEFQAFCSTAPLGLVRCQPP
ncbi:MAG TPA: transposase [Gaiellaceae bacterium]|nr:transposase [Gaiellaceae bacterium]